MQQRLHEKPINIFENRDHYNHKFSLGIKGIKAHQILATLSIFYSNVQDKLEPQMQREFELMTKLMLEFIETQEENFRKHQSDSIAGSVAFLISSGLNMGKKEFLNGIKPLKKNLFKNIEKIKKCACYPMLKKGYKV